MSEKKKQKKRRSVRTGPRINMSEEFIENIDAIHKQFVMGVPMIQIANEFGINKRMLKLYATREGWDKERRFVFHAGRNVFLEKAIESQAGIQEAFLEGWGHFAAQVIERVKPQVEEDGTVAYDKKMPTRDLRDLAYVFLMANRQMNSIAGLEEKNAVERIEVVIGEHGDLRAACERVIHEQEGSPPELMNDYLEPAIDRD